MRSLVLRASIFVILLYLAGCSTTGRPTQSILDSHEPEIGEIVEAELGETLFKRRREIGVPGVYLNAPVEVRSGVGGVFRLSPQKAALADESEEKAFYSLAGESCGLGICSRLQITIVNYKLQNRWALKTSPISEKTIESFPGETGLVSFSANNNFKVEFIYNGRTGDEIKFIYREFINDLARPAFTQDLVYDLSADDVIGFKGMRLRVIEASNTSIEYSILEQISDPVF